MTRSFLILHVIVFTSLTAPPSSVETYPGLKESPYVETAQEPVLTSNEIGRGCVLFTRPITDRGFKEARAEIEGDTVVVKREGVLEPAAVRYAWADNPPRV